MKKQIIIIAIVLLTLTSSTLWYLGTKADFSNNFITMAFPGTNKEVSIHPALSKGKIVMPNEVKSLISQMQKDGWKKCKNSSVGFFRIFVGVDDYQRANLGQGAELSPIVAGKSKWVSTRSANWQRKLIDHTNIQFKNHGNGMISFWECK